MSRTGTSRPWNRLASPPTSSARQKLTQGTIPSRSPSTATTTSSRGTQLARISCFKMFERNCFIAVLERD